MLLLTRRGSNLRLGPGKSQRCWAIHHQQHKQSPPSQSMWAELSGENFRSPLTWVFAPPLPRSTAQSRTRSLRSIPLPAHLQFHPAPVKSLHARSNLKLLCMPKTCRFQPKPYASDTLSAWQTWSGFVAWLLRKKSASLLFCRGAAVAAWLDHTWYARIPQAMWLL